MSKAIWNTLNIKIYLDLSQIQRPEKLIWGIIMILVLKDDKKKKLKETTW